MKIKQKLGEFSLLLFLGIFGAACLLSESGADALTVNSKGFTVSFYTNLIAILLLILVFFRLAFLIIESRRETEREKTPEQIKKEHTIVIALTMFISVFFVYGMKKIGFYVCTSITLFILYMTFEQWKKKEIWKGIVFSLSICIVFFIVFKYLKVFLPNALLF